MISVRGVLLLLVCSTACATRAADDGVDASSSPGLSGDAALGGELPDAGVQPEAPRDGGHSQAEAGHELPPPDASLVPPSSRDAASNVPLLDAATPRPDATIATDSSIVDSATSIADASTPKTADAGDTAPPKVNRVFVTSARYTAALGGIAGADAICMTHAETAALTGQYQAWLSTAASSVDGRLPHSSDPYVLLDGTVIADDWEDLVDGALHAAPRVDERGDITLGDVWTGTLSDGQAYTVTDCEGFTSTEVDNSALCGNSGRADLTWTENVLPECSTALRLYCIERHVGTR